MTDQSDSPYNDFNYIKKLGLFGILQDIFHVYPKEINEIRILILDIHLNIEIRMDDIIKLNYLINFDSYPKDKRYRTRKYLSFYDKLEILACQTHIIPGTKEWDVIFDFNNTRNDFAHPKKRGVKYGDSVLIDIKKGYKIDVNVLRTMLDEVIRTRLGLLHVRIGLQKYIERMKK